MPDFSLLRFTTFCADFDLDSLSISDAVYYELEQGKVIIKNSNKNLKLITQNIILYYII